MHKEIRSIWKRVRAKHPDYYLEPGGKHVKIKTSEGKTIYTLPTTPGGPRWQKNLVADLRRKGLID